MKTILLFSILALTGCAHTISAIPETVREGVYATNGALHAGRYDLAERYSDQTLRIVPAPKSRTVIKPATRTVTKQAVNILPLDAAVDSVPELKLGSAITTDQQAQQDAAAFQHAVDQQTVQDAADKAKAVAQVQADKVKLAAASKYRWIVWTAIGAAVLALGLFIAWKLKFLAL